VDGGELLCKDGGEGQGDIPMLFLSPVGAAQVDVVYPRANRAHHIDPAGGVHGEDFAGALLRDASLEHVVVEFLRFGEEHHDPSLESLYQLGVKIRDGVLTVLRVLAAKFGHRDLTQVLYVGVTLGELLEAE